VYREMPGLGPNGMGPSRRCWLIGHGQKLGRKQEAAIATLLSQRTMEDAARVWLASGREHYSDASCSQRPRKAAPEVSSKLTTDPPRSKRR
jgi:hypothetical protein